MLQSPVDMMHFAAPTIVYWQAIIGSLRRADEGKALFVVPFVNKEDPLLTPLLQASSDILFEQHLSDIIASHGSPLIRSVLQRKAGGFPRSQQELEDLQEEVVLKLIQRLRVLRSGQSDPIESFEDYVARMAERAWIDRLRSRHPQRSKLKKRIRYLLTHDADFLLILDARGIWTCSFSPGGPPGMQQLLAPVENFRGLPSAARTKQAICRLLSERTPLELDALVSGVWETLGLQETAQETPSVPLEAIPDRTLNPASLLEHREFLGRVWREVRELRSPQRAALLLNMRDGEGRDVLSLLPLLGIATFAEIAHALDLSAERLAAFWNDLPLPDAHIADLLSVSRQQVINLRKSARERLSRRLNFRPGEPL